MKQHNTDVMHSKRASAESLKAITSKKTLERATTNMNQHTKLGSDLGVGANHNASMDCLIMPQPNANNDSSVVDMLKPGHHRGSILVNDYAELDKSAKINSDLRT